MVLGLRAKNRGGPSVKVEYLIHVQDIKPWPPTQSLKTVRSVLIQWDNGDRNSGSTSAVAPSITDGKIEFNESFRLPVVLSRDMSVKNGDMDVFHKNLLELNLYEPRRDKTVKGQLLGTAIVDLADYGVINEVTNVNVPMNCTRSFRNTAQPVLYLKIQPCDRARSSSTLRGKLAKESSLEKNGGDSVSALMSEEYADEAEVASLTDDDVSSHSSLTASSALESNGASPSQNNENGAERGNYSTGMRTENQDHERLDMMVESESNDSLKDGSSRAISVGGSSGPVSPNNATTSLSDNSDLEFVSNPENAFVSSGKSSTLFHAQESELEFQKKAANLEGRVHSKSVPQYDAMTSASKLIPMDVSENENSENDAQHVLRRKKFPEVATIGDIDDVETDDGDKYEQSEQEGRMLEEKRHCVGYESSSRLSQDVNAKQVLSGTDSPLSRDRLRLVKSVRSPMDSARGHGSLGGGFKTALKQEAKIYPAEKGTASPYTKSQELEQRLKMLEGELIEAAGIEVALYSVVAEHGSSINKVHTPARRLSRLYFQAEEGMRRASTARSAVSGLVLVAKACGNDVPRLTFWLSNCVMLRAIVTEAFGEEHLPISSGASAEQNGEKKGMNKKSSMLEWKVSSSGKKGNRSVLGRSIEDWEDPQTFLFALEKVEFWIFLRIVESVWWQTLTPHMQSSAAKVVDKILDSGGRRNYRRTSSCDPDQVNLSLELWKKAFKDACERLCPLRAGGHECGCLPVLAKLIMEQCVARLDVAMLNATLRESADEIPTDPVSDPISDAKVLPILSGKSSFGAGAQLKNAIGNWSRWLTDLFGMDDDDATEDERDDDGEIEKSDSSFKSFYLLKSLSDLMMLPKDMLLNESIRKEVCPAFGAQLIKRVLENFSPDEFCPDPVPDAVFEALDSEDAHGEGEGEGSITSFPCTAPAVVYSPPPASSLAHIIGGSAGTGSQSHLRRSGSVLRRSNTSDDELDELDSPLNSIIGDSLLASSPVEMRSNRNAIQNLGKSSVRYQLLRQMWANDRIVNVMVDSCGDQCV